MTINQAVILAKKLLSNHIELKGWTVALNYRKRAFGVCNYRKTQIELSSHLIPIMTEDAIKDTIIHEIAHALTKGHGHDGVWKTKCIELGGNGQRLGGSEKYEGGIEGRELALEKIAKYTLTCPDCGSKYHFNRKPKNARSCGKHGKKFNPLYKLVLTQNY